MTAWGWLTGLTHCFSGTVGLFNSQANELSGSPVGTWRWGLCSRDWPRPQPPPPALIRVPRRVTALGGNCLFWWPLLQVQPCEMGFHFRRPVDTQEAEGVPARAPRPAGPVVGGDTGSLWPCLQMRSDPSLWAAAQEAHVCTGWRFIAEKLFRKVKGLQLRPRGGAPKPLRRERQFVQWALATATLGQDGLILSVSSSLTRERASCEIHAQLPLVLG